MFVICLEIAGQASLSILCNTIYLIIKRLNTRFKKFSNFPTLREKLGVFKTVISGQKHITLIISETTYRNFDECERDNQFNS